MSATEIGMTITSRGSVGATVNGTGVVALEIVFTLTDDVPAGGHLQFCHTSVFVDPSINMLTCEYTDTGAFDSLGIYICKSSPGYSSFARVGSGNGDLNPSQPIGKTIQCMSASRPATSSDLSSGDTVTMQLHGTALPTGGMIPADVIDPMDYGLLTVSGVLVHSTAMQNPTATQDGGERLFLNGISWPSNSFFAGPGDSTLDWDRDLVGGASVADDDCECIAVHGADGGGSTVITPATGYYVVGSNNDGGPSCAVIYSDLVPSGDPLNPQGMWFAPGDIDVANYQVLTPSSPSGGVYYLDH